MKGSNLTPPLLCCSRNKLWFKVRVNTSLRLVYDILDKPVANICPIFLETGIGVSKSLEKPYLLGGTS